MNQLAIGMETKREKWRLIPDMSAQYRAKFASRLLLAALPIALAGASASALAEAASAQRATTDPLHFFEGRTEMVSTVKVVTRKPYKSRTLGKGEIGSDGVLTLIQQVQEAGKSPHDRKWRMRKVGPNRYSGTMTEAVGPVTVDEIGGRYRFRFKMKGNLSIEQWLTPQPGGTSAQSKVTIRKLGMTVGRSDGVIRKL
jgi:hypothetical protein